MPEKFETQDQPVRTVDKWRVTNREKRRAFRNFGKWLRKNKPELEGILDAEVLR